MSEQAQAPAAPSVDRRESSIRPPSPDGRQPRQLAQNRRAQRPLLDLHRTAGNQAVATVIQRSVRIGQPGMGQVLYGAGQLGNVQVLIAGTLAAMPAWVGAWINPVGGGGPLAAIVNGAQDYDFDTAPQIVDWLLLRALATGWLNVMQAAAAPGNIDQRGVDARTRFAAVEQQRALFATAGGAGPAHGAPLAGVAPNFTLFGRGYVVALSGPNHYYAHHGGAAIQYSAGAFSRANASAVVDHLVAHGAATPYPGPQSHVDEFVCAFLAEPTRWPADQAFNMLAITSGANAADQMTGADLAGTLPMAAGTTWSAINQVVGRNLPKRALEHANREGIRLIIDQELPPSTSQNNFALRVMRQLGLLQ